MTGRITPEIWAAALYLSDYFNAWIKEGPISHTWSLSVEEHFYLLWPIVLSTWCKSKRFAPAVAAVIILVQSARFAFASAYPLYFFYSFEAKIDALLLGCVLGLWAGQWGGYCPWPCLRAAWSLTLMTIDRIHMVREPSHCSGPYSLAVRRSHGFPSC